MKRSELEHIIRAAGAITTDDEFIVIGSQAILGAFPNAPEVLLRSMELDLYPKNLPDQSMAIEGAIGESSLFHKTFGYHAHGVGPDTAVLPEGWQNRLVLVRNQNTRGVTGWCLEPTDLAVSKLVAGREHDLDFVGEMLRHRLIEPGAVQERLRTTPLDAARHTVVEQRLARLAHQQ